MALSGTLTASGGYGNRTLEFSWTAVQSIDDNSSTLSWTLKGVGGKQTYYYALRKAKLTIDDEVVYQQPYNDRIELRIGTVLATGTKVIKHDSVGAGSFNVAVEGAIYVGSVNTTGSQTFKLNDIPRQATITSAPNFSDEDAPVVSYFNPLGNKAKLQMGIFQTDAVTPIVGYKPASSNAGSYTFTFSQADLNKIYELTKNTNSLKVRFYLKTNIGEDSYLNYAERTLTIANGAPVLNPTVVDVNAETLKLTGDKNKLIVGFSDAECKFNVSAVKGATIKSKWLQNGDLHLTNDGILSKGNSPKFVFSVRDTRDNTNQKVVEPVIVPYYPVSCSIGNSAPNAQGNFMLTVNGRCFKSNFGKVANTLNIWYRMKEANAKEWGQWIVTSAPAWGNDGNYISETPINGLDYRITYVFQVKAVDALCTAISGERKVKTSPIFDWSKDDVSFNVPVHFNAGADGLCQVGEWTPQSPQVDFTNVHGGYMRNGRMCCITWFATGKCNQNSDTFYITGLPFKPDANIPWQAGGGNITNNTAYANHAFCSYNIEGQKVYARTSNTATTNGLRKGGYCGTKTGEIIFCAGSLNYWVDSSEP